MKPNSGYYFPEKIVSMGYAVPWIKVKGVSKQSLSKLSDRLVITDTVHFIDVDLNPEFDGEDFTIKIPPNSLWIDEISRETFQSGNER